MELEDGEVIGYVSVLESGTMQKEADTAAAKMKRKAAKQVWMWAWVCTHVRVSCVSPVCRRPCVGVVCVYIYMYLLCMCMCVPACVLCLECVCLCLCLSVRDNPARPLSRSSPRSSSMMACVCRG